MGRPLLRVLLGEAMQLDEAGWRNVSLLQSSADTAELPGPFAAFLELTYTPGGLAGDYDKSGVLDEPDLNLQAQQMARRWPQYSQHMDTAVDTCST